MRPQKSLFLLLLAVLSFLLPSCEEREVAPDESSFVLNGRTGHFQLQASADVQTLRMSLRAAKSWSVEQEGVPADWVECRWEKRTEGYWQVFFSLDENPLPNARQAVFVFSSGTLVRKVTLVQAVEDPIFRVHNMGAYGVPGGDIVFTPGESQYSLLNYAPDAWSFRLLEPSAARVMSLSGLPRPIEAGMQVKLHFRVMERGFIRISEPLNLLVIRVREPLVWLKKDDDTYFVVKQP